MSAWRLYPDYKCSMIVNDRLSALYGVLVTYTYWWRNRTENLESFNPLTAGVAYIRFFIFLLAH